MRRIFKALHRLAHHPALDFTAGAVLLLVGLMECLASLYAEVHGVFPFRIHHAVAFVGALQMVRAFPDTFRGIQFIDDGSDKAAAPRVTPASAPPADPNGMVGAGLA